MKLVKRENGDVDGFFFSHAAQICFESKNLSYFVTQKRERQRDRERVDVIGDIAEKEKKKEVISVVFSVAFVTINFEKGRFARSRAFF